MKKSLLITLLYALSTNVSAYMSCNSLELTNEGNPLFSLKVEDATLERPYSQTYLIQGNNLSTPKKFECLSFISTSANEKIVEVLCRQRGVDLSIVARKTKKKFLADLYSMSLEIDTHNLVCIEE